MLMSVEDDYPIGSLWTHKDFGENVRKRVVEVIGYSNRGIKVKAYNRNRAFMTDLRRYTTVPGTLIKLDEV